MTGPRRTTNATPELEADRLHAACDPATLGFTTTTELEPLAGALGQDDAMAALEFGLRITAQGYNIFAVGSPGSGRLSFIRRSLQARARSEPAPDDWCYVYNFDDPRRPRALPLPPGKAPRFAADVERLIKELRSAIPQALRSDDVAARRAALVEEREKPAAKALDELRRELELDPYVALVGGPEAIMIVPARDGEPLPRDAYNRLPENIREEIDQHVRDARARLFAVQRTVHELERDAQESVNALNQDVARSVVEHRVDGLKERYRDLEKVTAYLDRLADDVVEHAEKFSNAPGEAENPAQKIILGTDEEEFFRRYTVNVIVTRRPGEGAPVIEEPNPNLNNLLGRFDRVMHLGAVITDFTHITAGALHRANGGYLILDARELLTRPLAWPALKRTLQARELRPADLADELGLVVTQTLEPEAIEPRVKVVLVGDEGLYQLLHGLDEEFRELFKVKADFRPSMERTAEAVRGYARFVAALAEQESLPPFDASAVAALVEEGSRDAGDQRKLSTRFGTIADLVREAAYWTRDNGLETVSAEHVERAILERDRRNRRVQREVLELIERDILTFEPRGDAVGQVFGIGLMASADGLFGRPIRVMASAHLGTGGVINIEREAKLSGRIHSKGFLVLSGYLGARFAHARPLLLSANLSFDQMYEEVEGDSASVAELYALLSAIGGVPIRQGIAVTGALNQTGLVLPVGGVTQKVEGFFSACQRVGLTGDQGVILPRRNVEHLVLRREVRDAVAAGKFHIYAIDRVEEGWPILAGREAGVADDDGEYPPGTVHHDVARRLAAWADAWRSFGRNTVTSTRTDQEGDVGPQAAAAEPGPPPVG